MGRPPDPRANRGDRDVAAVVLLVGLGVLAVTTCVLWAGAAAASVVTGHAVPAYSTRSTWTALCHPDDLDAAWQSPMPSPGLVWTCTVVITAGLISTAIVLWKRLAHLAGPITRSRRLDKSPGMATASDVQNAAGARAVLSHAQRLRPSLTKPTPEDVGFSFGRSHHAEVWTTVEDSTLVIGPSRSGKGHHIVIPAVLDAPGAVVSTSTRTDVLAATFSARQRIGPVAVFDPQHLAPDIPAGLSWSPVRGCEDPQTAMIRARGLAAGAKFGKGVENGDFWASQTEAVLRCLLHAAALGGHNARDLYRWSLDPVAAMQAQRVLVATPAAADGWAETLEAAATADPRTRDSIWLGVRQAFAALADPRVLAAVTPTDQETFDPATFVRERGTLYLLGTAAGSGGTGSLVAALIEDLVETARQRAATSPGARLDPPITLVLDEIANLAPLPSLPTLMSEGGGSGITTITVLQTMAQARETFGEHLANTIWDASVVKLLLGGAENPKDLQDIVALIGDRDDETVAVTRGPRGETTRQTSYRRIPILDTGTLRTLPFGQAVLLLRSAPPIALSLRPWTARRDADQLREDRATIEDRLAPAPDEDFKRAG